MNLFFGSFKSVPRKANLFVMNAVSENVLEKSVAKNGERFAESTDEEWHVLLGLNERGRAFVATVYKIREGLDNNMAFGLTKKEFSWVLYDVGNSAFVMLSTALIPVYFASIAEEGSSVVVAWGYAETVASLILALLMPFLGSLADLAGNKKKFLIGQ